MTKLIEIIQNQAKDLADIAKEGFQKNDPRNVEGVNDTIKMPTRAEVNATIASILSNPSFLRATGPSDKAVPTQKQFEPYEKLTGIAHERPEIVMLSQFEPLFHKQIVNLDKKDTEELANRMTRAGEYVELQVQANKLRLDDISHVLVSAARADINVKAAVNKKLTEMNDGFVQLGALIDFLMGIVRGALSMKDKLDLRHEIFKINVAKDVPPPTQNSTKKFTQLNKDFSLTKISAQQSNFQNSAPVALSATSELNASEFFSSQYLPSTFDIQEVLTKFGYTKSRVLSLYTSTKLWYQLLLEFKHVLQAHSLDFINVIPTAQRADTSATKLVKVTSQLFGLTNRDPQGVGPLDNMFNDPSANFATVITNLSRAVPNLYQNKNLLNTPENKISVLINALTKEIKYSIGLNRQEIKSSLEGYYKYSISDVIGNIRMFDEVIGRFPDDATVVTAEAHSSLADLALLRPADNVVIATFEPTYVGTNNNGTLTPGGVFFIDKILDASDLFLFDTTNLERFSALLKRSHTEFTAFIKGMSIFDVKSANFYTTLPQFATALLDGIVDKQGISQSHMRDDITSAVFAAGANNDRLKAVLLAFVMKKIYGASQASTVPPNSIFAPGNFLGREPEINGAQKPAQTEQQMADAVADDEMLEHIIAELSNVTPTRVGNSAIPKPFTTSNNVDRDTIKAALSAKQSVTIKNVINFMTKIIDALAQGTAGGRIKYSGNYDTVVVFAAFDLLLTTMSTFTNVILVSKQLNTVDKKGKTVFVAARAPVATDRKSTVTSILTRLNKEEITTEQITRAVLNVLTQLTNSADDFLTLIQSDASVAKLEAIGRVLDDTGLLKMMMSEQQMQLISSTAKDVIARYRDKSVSNTLGYKPLDDRYLDQRMRDMFYSVMGSEEFVGTRAKNKKIISVGIPHDFSHRLRQKTSPRTTASSVLERQRDIVNVCIYKIDLLNEALIFQPKKFMFELSRFPVRAASKYDSSSKTFVTIQDVLSSVPMRDFAESVEQGLTDDVSFFDHVDSNKGALSSSSYSFLTGIQKKLLIRNHILSMFFETYIKLMSGVPVGEHVLDIRQAPPSPDVQLVDALFAAKTQQTTEIARSKEEIFGTLSDVLPKMKGVIFSAANITATQEQSETRAKDVGAAIFGQKDKIQNVKPEQLMSPKTLSTTVRIAEVISEFSNTISTLSNDTALYKHILSPKIFERVFHVVVDSDEFVVDTAKMNSTTIGRDVLRKLIEQGEVLTDGSTRPRSEKDLAFEKYFVVVETAGGDVI